MAHNGPSWAYVYHNGTHTHTPQGGIGRVRSVIEGDGSGLTTTCSR